MNSSTVFSESEGQVAVEQHPNLPSPFLVGLP